MQEACNSNIFKMIDILMKNWSLIIFLAGRCIIPAVAKSTTANNDSSLFQIRGIDFRNSKAHGVCMLAKLDIDFSITERSTNITYTKKLPSNASTKGSFCDLHFVSLLQLNFNGANVRFNFTKTKHSEDMKKHGTPKYCDHCNIGEWRLSELNFNIDNVGQFTKGKLPFAYGINSSASWLALTEASSDLTTHGIDITRSFSCHDSTKMKAIVMEIETVENKTKNFPTFVYENWEIRIQFQNVQIQPFLVQSKHFNDPYLCGDVTVAHTLVILLPILYFTVLILIYKLREVGCHKFRKRVYRRGNDVIDPIEKQPLEPQARKLLQVDAHAQYNRMESYTTSSEHNTLKVQV